MYLALDSVFVHFYVFLQFESFIPTIYKLIKGYK